MNKILRSSFLQFICPNLDMLIRSNPENLIRIICINMLFTSKYLLIIFSVIDLRRLTDSHTPLAVNHHSFSLFSSFHFNAYIIIYLLIIINNISFMIDNFYAHAIFSLILILSVLFRKWNSFLLIIFFSFCFFGQKQKFMEIQKMSCDESLMLSVWRAFVVWD